MLVMLGETPLVVSKNVDEGLNGEKLITEKLQGESSDSSGDLSDYERYLQTASCSIGTVNGMGKHSSSVICGLA